LRGCLLFCEPIIIFKPDHKRLEPQTMNWLAILLFIILAIPSVRACLESGVYRNNIGACVICPAGHGCPSDNETMIECKVGEFQNKIGSESCDECPGDYYSDSVQSITCKPCENNFTTTQGSSNCSVTCAEGYFHKWDQLIDGPNPNVCTKQTVCDHRKQFYTETSPEQNRTCVNLTACDTTLHNLEYCSIDGKSRKCRFRTNYIPTRHTLIKDHECHPWLRCSNNTYMYQQRRTDSSGVMVTDEDQICKPYVICDNATEYMLKNGRDSEDRNNVCMPFTNCTSLEFERFPVSLTTDRVCEPLTICNNETQYVQHATDGYRDNICLDITTCPVGSFRTVHATNSLDALVNGTDVECQNHATCVLGQGIETYGDSKKDTQCMDCIPGTYGTGVHCHACNTGIGFAPNTATVNCSTCQTCAGFNFSSLCNHTHDNQCIQSCPSSWNLDPVTRWCHKCAKGYFDEGFDECTICPANHYCPSKSTNLPCSDQQNFTRNGTIYIVPTSPPGSHLPSACKCNLQGGFQGIALGLTGCTACGAGTFATPSENDNSGPCEECPKNTYADVTGAVSCTNCPNGLFTHATGSQKESDCVLCDIGFYKPSFSGICNPCRPTCNSNEYVSQPCTSTTDLTCLTCDQNCAVNEEPGLCPGPVSPSKGCYACDMTIQPLNSMSIESTHLAYCLWQCKPGFFQIEDSQGIRCDPCTVRTPTTCPFGFQVRECSAKLDLACTVPCQNNTKPLLNSIWLENCQWECPGGYESMYTPGGLSFCREK
jgi:hypothetical protein